MRHLECAIGVGVSKSSLAWLITSRLVDPYIRAWKLRSLLRLFVRPEELVLVGERNPDVDENLVGPDNVSPVAGVELTVEFDQLLLFYRPHLQCALSVLLLECRLQ